MPISLQLIEQAIVLGDTGNFARAAERLGITQPTLSRNIAALEKKLGVRLFDRGRSGVAPTVFGRAVIERGSSLLRDSNALREELHALAGLDTGHLDIAAGPYVAEDLVGPAMARLLTESPRIRVRVTAVAPHEIEGEVLSGRHELGLGAMESQPAHDELAVEVLRKRRLFLAVRPDHPLAGGRPTQAQILSFPLVTVLLKGEAGREAATGSRAGYPDFLRKGFAPAVEVTSLDTAARIARDSNVIFPGSASTLATELSCGHLVRLDYDSPQLRTQPAIVRLRHRTLSPAARRFVDLVRAVESELVDAEEAEQCTKSAKPQRSRKR